MTVLTPLEVEQRLLELSKEIDENHYELVAAETKYYEVKGKFDVAIAQARLKIGAANAKLRVGDVADKALDVTAELYYELMAAEAIVKSVRASANRLRTQVDIIRSIGTSVRAAIEIN